MKKFYIIILVLFLMPLSVFAEEKRCNLWASQGKSVCESKTYNGKKCAWDDNKTGGARCYQSSKMAPSVTEKITSCTQITDSETCQSSKVNGVECIWRQNGCRAAADDGSNQTIIAEDEEQREEKEEANNQNNVVNTKPNVSNPVVGDFKFCEQVGVLKTFQLVSYLITVIKILVPLLLLIFGSIDMAKAVMGGDQKAIQSAASMLAVRAVGGVIIFFIPTIINVVTGLISNWSDTVSEFQNCETCLFSSGDCDPLIETAYLKEACTAANKIDNGIYKDEYNGISCKQDVCSKGTNSVKCK